LLDLQKKFNCLVGLSDHSIGSTVACTSVALGARIIEKHITLSSNDNAIDSFFSSDSKNFKNFVNDIKMSFKALGQFHYKHTKFEKSSLQERRSIYVINDIDKNEEFTKNNIAVIRPAYGLKPNFFHKVIGKKSKRKLKKGQRLKFSHF